MLAFVFIQSSWACCRNSAKIIGGMVSTSLSFDCSIEWTVSEACVNLGATDKGEGNAFEKMCSIVCGVGACHKHVFWKLCCSVNSDVRELDWCVSDGLDVFEGEAGNEILRK